MNTNIGEPDVNIGHLNCAESHEEEQARNPKPISAPPLEEEKTEEAIVTAVTVDQEAHVKIPEGLTGKKLARANSSPEKSS